MNWMGHRLRAELTRTSFYNALLIDLGTIGNIIKYEFSGEDALNKKY